MILFTEYIVPSIAFNTGICDTFHTASSLVTLGLLINVPASKIHGGKLKISPTLAVSIYGNLMFQISIYTGKDLQFIIVVFILLPV